MLGNHSREFNWLDHTGFSVKYLSLKQETKKLRAQTDTHVQTSLKIDFSQISLAAQKI